MTESKHSIERFLVLLVKKRGSDLHIKSGSTPKIRIDGSIKELSREILSPVAVDELLASVMSENDRTVFNRDQEVDFTFEIRNLGRFRINVYRQMMGLAIAIRHIRLNIPSFKELNLPPVLNSLINQPRGLLLVTGATGSGKSTTLAAMIETLNQTRSLNIITIEDPIEFSFKEKRCTIQQREVGKDTPSWSEALKRIIRQDPDVIMFGEIRDSETMLSALKAANTGHLVLSTLHTMDASQAINALIALAPVFGSGEIRQMLAATLAGIVSLRLIPRSDKKGMVPAVEVLIATETIRKLIANPEGELSFRQIIAEGHRQYSMQTFDQSLMDLHNSGIITIEDALKYATSPTDFRIHVRGIGDPSGLTWMEEDYSDEN